MFIDVAFLSDTFLKLCAALPVTLGLFICSFLCGGVLAVGVLALRMSRWPLLSSVAKGYILVFRGSPLLVSRNGRGSDRRQVIIASTLVLAERSHNDRLYSITP